MTNISIPFQHMQGSSIQTSFQIHRIIQKQAWIQWTRVFELILLILKRNRSVIVTIIIILSLCIVKLEHRYKFIVCHYLQGILMLPMSFVNIFRDDIDEYANLMDRYRNSFELKVDKMAKCIVLTTGCGALRDFYNISSGVWMTLIYVGGGNFWIKKIRSKNKKKMVIPVCEPPMRFEIDRDVSHGVIFDGIVDSVYRLSYRHNPSNFSIYYERLLRQVDIASRYLVRDYIDFCFGFNNVCLCRLCLINDIIYWYCRYWNHLSFVSNVSKTRTLI